MFTEKFMDLPNEVPMTGKIATLDTNWEKFKKKWHENVATDKIVSQTKTEKVYINGVIFFARILTFLTFLFIFFSFTFLFLEGICTLEGIG